MMHQLPGHALPNNSKDSREDALFHYTTGTGLLGILSNSEIWGTAYYCANDQSELRTGMGVLTPIFRSKTHDMIKEADPRVNIFRSRGIDIRDYADRFEQIILSRALNIFCVYITCFCKPSSKEDFLHGLLSQWRGYGVDGGYALQFSRAKLNNFIERANKDKGLNYYLQDVYYTPENPLKDEIDNYTDAFIGAYLDWLETLAKWDFIKKTMQNPIASLLNGPLKSFLDYIIHTKSSHFGEEKECRMSILEPISSEMGVLPVDYFNRKGLIIPFTRTPRELNIIDCVEWIIIGPGQRIEDRFNSIRQMVRKMGLKIQVRPSHIPLSRA